MKYIEYLGWPVIPENLLEPIQDIINKPPKDTSSVSATYPNFKSDTYPYFKTRDVNSDLKNWLQTVFNFKIDPQYQLIYDGLPIHIDVFTRRIYAYNYLLDTGGIDVKTAIYDEQHNTLQSETLELKRWHRIPTNMPHCVHGIQPDKVRVAVSIGYYGNI